MGLIFDLDQTIVDSQVADEFRKQRNWSRTYALIKDFKLYEGITNVLRYATQNGLKVCIVTSGQGVYFKKVVQHWSIPYDFSVCYHDTTRRKPYPDPIFKGLELLKVPAEKALSFGDRAIDIQASKSAKVKSVGCLWGTLEEAELKEATPNFLAKKPNDLIPIIKDYFGLQNDKVTEDELF